MTGRAAQLLETCREGFVAISTAQEFLTVLEKSKLLSADHLAAARQQAAQAGGNPRSVIESLMQRRLLTRWQVNQLLGGHTSFYIGKYKLLDKIGAGGMGMVFKAEHVNMGRVVALKLISSELLNKPDSVARFRREVHMAASLHHPNIVTAYDADQVGRHHFLVMEYVEGNSLHEWIKQHGRLPIDWASECIRQAALGLEYAHRMGVVHRDIKPNNLLVVANDTTGIPIVKILDMGLARSASEELSGEELTHSDQVLGTPDYMSPEQAEDSRTADLRSDVFSLGCTFFKLLTGQVPYGGKSAMEKLTARLRGDAPRVGTLRPEVPPGLDAIVARMLARQPNDRFQNCQEVAKALEPYAAGTAGASEESSSIMLCNEARSWSPSQAHADSALQQFLGALSTAPDQNTPAMGHSRTLVEPRSTPLASKAPLRPGQGRKDLGQRRTLLLGSSAAVGCLLAVGLLWMLWPRPAVLLVQWPPDQRHGALLSINGQEQFLTPNGQVLFQLQPGTYRVFLARRGYEPVSEEKNIARGEQWILVPKWNKVALALPTFETKVDLTQAADAGQLKKSWLAEQAKRDQQRMASLPQRKQELEQLRDAFKQSAKATPEQAAALRAKVADFRKRWLGSAEAGQAVALLLELPSAADALDRGQIPRHELAAAGSGKPEDAPQELAWVFGDGRLSHDGKANVVAFSPDGGIAAVGTDKGIIALWNPVTGLLVRELKGAHAATLRALAFSPDGRRLASAGDDGIIQLWDAANGQQGFRLSGHSGRVRSLAFSRDGKWLASGGQDGVVRIWESSLGELRHSLSGHTSEIVSVAYHPLQDIVATGSTDKTARIWDAVGGQERQQLAGHTSHVNGVAFTSDGKRLFTAGNDGLVKVWDGQAFGEMFTMNWDGGGINYLSVSRQGDHLAIGNGARVWIRSTTDGLVLQKLDGSVIYHAAISPDGATVGLCMSSSLRLFDATTGQLRLPAPSHAATPRWTEFSPAGDRLYSTGFDETVQEWDVAGGQRRYERKTAQGESLAVSPDGQLIAMAYNNDATIRLLDAATGLERMALAGHAGGNYAVAFHPDGTKLASGGQDQTIRIWSLETRAEISQLSGPAGNVTTLNFAPDGRLYAGYQNGEINVWDVSGRKSLLSLNGHRESITCLALHPSGQYLASGSTDDTISIWDLHKAEALKTLSIPGANIHDVLFALDGQTLLSTSTQWSIRFWDFHSGQQLRVLQMSELQPFRMSLSPEGRFVAAGLRNGSIALLRIVER